MDTTRTARYDLRNPPVARVRDTAFAVDVDDVRRFDYTQGWDDDDAALGWVDAESVSRPPRLH